MQGDVQCCPVLLSDRAEVFFLYSIEIELIQEEDDKDGSRYLSYESAIKLVAVLHNLCDGFGDNDDAFPEDNRAEQTHALHEMGAFERYHSPVTGYSYRRNDLCDVNCIPHSIRARLQLDASALCHVFLTAVCSWEPSCDRSVHDGCSDCRNDDKRKWQPCSPMLLGEPKRRTVLQSQNEARTHQDEQKSSRSVETICLCSWLPCRSDHCEPNHHREVQRLHATLKDESVLKRTLYKEIEYYVSHRRVKKPTYAFKLAASLISFKEVNVVRLATKTVAVSQ